MAWDEGGVPGEWVIRRDTLTAPERVLSPAETAAFERMAEMVRRWYERGS